MAHTIKVEVPDEVYQPLLRCAKEAGRTPEQIAAEWLSTRAKRAMEDPLLELAGCLTSPLTDVGERHDDYLGETLAKELSGNGDA